MEQQSVKQAFGSPGGKTKLASKIVPLMPEHRIYVEPFAGGAAVYFKKGASDTDVLNDKDARISFAFRFIRDMTEPQFERLKKMNWRASPVQFKRVQRTEPKDDVEKFYKFYYTRWASFGSGAKSFSRLREGQVKQISHLPKLKQRLRNTRVHSETAAKIIKKYDSPHTFFYLDPPYPDRAFIGSTFGKYTVDDLAELVKTLKNIKGRFLLSLSTEHLKHLPSNWAVKRIKLRRNIPRGDEEWNQAFQYEIVVANYNMGDKVRPSYHVGLIGGKRGKSPKFNTRLRRRKLVKPVTQSLAGMRG